MVRKKVRLMNSRKIFQTLKECAEPSANAFYMHNRNPRNLEMMKIAQRPDGYHLEAPGRCFWHKLVIDKNTKCLTARVQHYTGKVLLESSTDEWCIAQHLYKAYDTSAYINFGRIFAQRCLEAGIIEMENYNESIPGGKLEKFFQELEKNGLKLKESPRYIKKYAFDIERMDKPWMIQNE